MAQALNSARIFYPKLYVSRRDLSLSRIQTKEAVNSLFKFFLNLTIYWQNAIRYIRGKNELQTNAAILSWLNNMKSSGGDMVETENAN
jgi:hypothetical protein